MWKPQSLSIAISLLLDYILRWKIRYVDRRGDFRMRDLAARDIEAVAQMRIIGERLLPALVGKREHEGQRGVVERVGRSARHRAGHVGDAVMHHVVDHVGGIGVRGRPRGLEAAAL